jgi:hypothetical protein
MPDPATIALLASLGFKGLSSLFGGRSRRKKEDESRRATTAGLTLAQKQREDARRARLALASGLLGGVPATTAGGGVRTNVGLDPALLARLDQERTYDFGSTLPRSVGGIDAFLEGLLGGAADVVPRMIDPEANAAAGGEGASGSPSAGGGFLPRPTVTIDDLQRLQRQGG